MAFDKLRHESLKDSFVKQIQQMIFSGELKPGERLPAERDLAEQMGVSRSLANIGLLELESQGFLRIEPRRGSFVLDYRKDGTMATFAALMNYDAEHIDPALFSGMIEARALIESECAANAVLRASDSELDVLETQLDIMRQNEINDAFVEASVSFHYLLTLASHNPVYAMLFRSITPVVRHFTVLHYTRNAHREKTIALHQALLDALRGRDPKKAAEAAKTALSLGEQTLQQQFESHS